MLLTDALIQLKSVNGLSNVATWIRFSFDKRSPSWNDSSRNIIMRPENWPDMYWHGHHFADGVVESNFLIWIYYILIQISPIFLIQVPPPPSRPGVIANDKSDVYAKGQGQRSKIKVTEVNTQLSRFRTVTPVWIHIWWWNDAQSFILLRRGALLFNGFEMMHKAWCSIRRGVPLFFDVIHRISRTHGLKNLWFRSNLSTITRPVAAIKSLRFALFFIFAYD